MRGIEEKRGRRRRGRSDRGTLPPGVGVVLLVVVLWRLGLVGVGGGGGVGLVLGGLLAGPADDGAAHDEELFGLPNHRIRPSATRLITKVNYGSDREKDQEDSARTISLWSFYTPPLPSPAAAAETLGRSPWPAWGSRRSGAE